jgi:hypothetical protein
MYQYSFANVDLIIEMDIPGQKAPTHFEVKGYGTGEGLINIVRRQPIANTTFGAYGDMVVNMHRILAGDLTFPILMNAPENAYLQEYANYFQSLADGDDKQIKPLQAKLVDNMGNDSATLQNGVILAMPSMVRGQMMNTVTWVLTFEKVTYKRDIGVDAL